MQERAVPSRQVPRGKPLLAIVFVLGLLAPEAVAAQQSTLQQQLLEPDCTIAGQCEMEKPTIDEVIKNGNKPIIRGTYDAAYSRHLRVIFGGKTYTLGEDGQLTAIGREWELNLSTLVKPLGPGAYELVVETEGYDSEIKRVETIVILPPLGSMLKPDDPTAIPQEPADEAPAPNEPADTPMPMAPEKSWVKVSLVPLLITLGVSAAVFVLRIVLAKRKRTD